MIHLSYIYVLDRQIFHNLVDDPYVVVTAVQAHEHILLSLQNMRCQGMTLGLLAVT